MIGHNFFLGRAIPGSEATCFVAPATGGAMNAIPAACLAADAAKPTHAAAAVAAVATEGTSID